MILTHNNNELYSATTSLGLIVYNAPREAAAQAIVAAVEGLELEQAYEMLDSPAPVGEWRATLAAGMASDLSTLQSQIDESAIADQTIKDELTNKIEQLSSQVLAEVTETRRQQAIRDEIQWLEKSLFNPARVAQVEEQLGNRFTLNDAINLLYNTPDGQRLIQLRREAV